MCTTTLVEDKVESANESKINCFETACRERCQGIFSETCVQIQVMPRIKGPKVELTECKALYNEECTALNVSLTDPVKCEKGECDFLTGVYFCEREGDNRCFNVTPAYDCSNATKSDVSKTCDDEGCGEVPLMGLFTCDDGVCYRIKENYETGCPRRCGNLKFDDKNVVVFGQETYASADCAGFKVTFNNKTVDRKDDVWTSSSNDPNIFFLTCTYVTVRKTSPGMFEIDLDDCFNGTKIPRSEVEGYTTFKSILDFYRPNNVSDAFVWDEIIKTEQNLSIMDDMPMRINPDSCVEYRSRACKNFFSTHAHDGSIGRTASRFPCYKPIDNSVKYLVAYLTLNGIFTPGFIRGMFLASAILLGSIFFFSSLGIKALLDKLQNQDDKWRVNKRPLSMK